MTTSSPSLTFVGTMGSRSYASKLASRTSALASRVAARRPSCTAGFRHVEEFRIHRLAALYQRARSAVIRARADRGRTMEHAHSRASPCRIVPISHRRTAPSGIRSRFGRPTSMNSDTRTTSFGCAGSTRPPSLTRARSGLGPDVYFELGVVWVVRRHDIEYLLPALEGEELDAWTWVETLRGATSLRRTVIRRDDRDLARAATTWVLIDTADEQGPGASRPRCWSGTASPQREGVPDLPVRARRSASRSL